MTQQLRDLSDHDLAMMLERFYETKNLLKGSSGVWLFDKLVWRNLQDEEIKATAIQVLTNQVDKVMRGRLSCMIDIFKSIDWVPNLQFEQGDLNTVVLADGYRKYSDSCWKAVPIDQDLRRRVAVPWSYTDAKPIKFDQFLDEILCKPDGLPLVDRDQLRQLIWEMLGYCLVTHTRFEQCFILCGKGANGKSVLGNVAKEMVGRVNTTSIQPTQMGNVFQRSNLEGKLLNLVTELNQNEELEDGMLKAIVSGEMMSVEKKFQNPREIEPYAKHIILTNHMPRIRDYSDGLFRRVSIIELQRQFLGDADDPHLIDKLKCEMDAITSRALDAVGRLIDRGGQFTKPQSSEVAKSNWKANNNHLHLFLSECVKDNQVGNVGVQTLYDAYDRWFATSGLRARLGRNHFSQRVEATGIPKTRTNRGCCFIGISLTAPT